MFLCKPKAVYAASEQQYTTAGGDVQVPKGCYLRVTEVGTPGD